MTQIMFTDYNEIKSEINNTGQLEKFTKMKKLN